MRPKSCTQIWGWKPPNMSAVGAALADRPAPVSLQLTCSLFPLGSLRQRVQSVVVTSLARYCTALTEETRSNHHNFWCLASTITFGCKKTHASFWIKWRHVHSYAELLGVGAVGRAAAVVRKLHDGIGQMVGVCPVGCSRNRINMQHLTALASETCSSATDVRREKSFESICRFPWKLTVTQANWKALLNRSDAAGN